MKTSQSSWCVAERGILTSPGPPSARRKASRRSLASRGRRTSPGKGRTAIFQARPTADGLCRVASPVAIVIAAFIPQSFKHIKSLLLHRPNKNRPRERSGLKATLSQAVAYIISKAVEERDQQTQKTSSWLLKGKGTGLHEDFGINIHTLMNEIDN